MLAIDVAGEADTPNLDFGAAPVLPGPFGPRRVVYADFTASGRSLPAIERAIQDLVLPTYGNTHTEASFTGATTTRLRERARQAIRRGVNASDAHAVIFAGSGTTAAVNKLVAMLGLAGPTGPRERDLLLAQLPAAERPVVFVGPYEHHSNELPWRESLATVVRLPLDWDGRPDLRALEDGLAAHAGRPQRYVALSATSNVTGVITDIAAAARIAHRHGAQIFADYAASAPYLPIDMSGTGTGDHLDAVYFSPHKFLGGPGASGVLVCDRRLHRVARPTAPGGGTVRYVTPSSQHYVDNIELLEEAGTPAILGDIRAGLVVELKADIGTAAIHATEQMALDRALRRWAEMPGIELLGPLSADRLPIIAFNIRIGGQLLHHNLVVRLLNDLFGIQARGGCSCAGPYGHELLGIDEARSLAYQELIDQGRELSKPGWVRLGFHFTMPEETVTYILEAVAFIARHGLALQAHYTADSSTGLWTARNEREAADGWAQLCAWRGTATPLPVCDAPSFAECFRRAEAIARDSVGVAEATPVADASAVDRRF